MALANDSFIFLNSSSISVSPTAASQMSSYTWYPQMQRPFLYCVTAWPFCTCVNRNLHWVQNFVWATFHENWIPWKFSPQNISPTEISTSMGTLCFGKHVRVCAAGLSVRMYRLYHPYEVYVKACSHELPHAHWMHIQSCLLASTGSRFKSMHVRCASITIHL